MDSRERVHRAVRREGVDRAPRDLWDLPATRPALGPGYDALLARWPRDIAKTGFAQWRNDGNLFGKGQSRDVWGSVWSNEQEGLLGIVSGHPLDDESVFEGWEPPWDEIGPAVEKLPRQVAEMSGDQFRLGGSLELFHRMCWLRPMEKVMMDLYMAPELFAGILAKVAAFFDRLLEELLRLDLDAVMIVDDWGSQSALFIRPADWRTHFAPHYRRWIEACHRAGKMCFMHSDGMILDIIPDLAAMGLDALNAEIDCMGHGRVDAARGGICLWGEIDRQSLLPRGTPAEVAEAGRRYLERFDRPEGGVILQSEIGPDVPLRNAEALLRVWGADPA